MLKKVFCCMMITLGFTCMACANAEDSEELSNTAYLAAHQIHKVSIGKSFANCKATKLTDKYIGLKTCSQANISDVYYMVTGFFHHTATQMFSKKTMRFIDRAGIKMSVMYKEDMTNFGLKAQF